MKLRTQSASSALCALLPCLCETISAVARPLQKIEKDTRDQELTIHSRHSHERRDLAHRRDLPLWFSPRNRGSAREMLSAKRDLQSENARLRLSDFLLVNLMIVHVARGGEIIGEFDEPTFQGKVFAGEIRPEDHYWVEGLADWKAVSQYRIAAKTLRMSMATPPLQAANDLRMAERQMTPGEKLCSNCGNIGRPRPASFWSVFSGSVVCPNCGGRDLIPVDSVVAQRYLSQQ
jgi:GYF domain 2